MEQKTLEEKNADLIKKINIELSQEEAVKNGKYVALEIIGHGAFGSVYKAQNISTQEVFAIKRVFQDKRYQNRELDILKQLHHPNTVTLKNYFYTYVDNEEKGTKEVYLNYIMEYSNQTLSKIIRRNFKTKTEMNPLLIKIFSFQMLKSLAYIHTKGITHRDIKPQNILIDETSNHLRLCDFGSAKKLIPGENSIAYICSRYYRAPELIFGATQYSNKIDIWSMGCAIAELVLSRPLFPGGSPSDQLVEIIRMLGTPSKDEIFSMNPQFKDHKFPQIKPVSWERIFRNKKVPEGFLDLLSKLVTYNPEKRLNAVKALCHPFFEELRKLRGKEENMGIIIPKDLFEFSKEEIELDKESYDLLINDNININNIKESMDNK